MTRSTGGERGPLPPLAALTTASAVGIAVFFTLYSLIPITRAQSPATASAFVGTLMAFVMAVQAGTPGLVRRLSLRITVMVALIVMAIGVIVVGTAVTTAPLLVGAAVSGAGFGTLVVAGAQGVGLLCPGPGLSRALGSYGLVTMASTAIGAPVGVQIGIAVSPATLAVGAAGLCLVGALATLGVPPGTGRASASGNVPAGEPSPLPTTFRLLGLTLGFLLCSVLLLSYALTGLPILTTASISPALVILGVQLGNALGRWLGGCLEPRLASARTILLAGLLLVSGTVASTLLPGHASVVIAAFVLGAGVGVTQTIALHTAMRRAGPGRASVLWNISIDGGLWLGGILTGLALAQDRILVGVAVVMLLVVVATLLLARQESHAH